MKKLLSEHIALTPIQAFLESESWAFYRGASTKDNRNCCINANYEIRKNNEGGTWKEDALSADILMSLAFISSDFIADLLGKLWKDDQSVKKNYYEVAGVQSNFYFPGFLTLEKLQNNEKEDDYLRIVQPDGWIVGDDLLVMIEAKGMRDGASFNFAQLAKEYLIAELESEARGIKPRILLLLTTSQKDKIQKDGLIELFRKSWKELTSEKAVKEKWSQAKVEFFQKPNIKKLLDENKPTDDEICSCFKILTYDELQNYAAQYAGKTSDASSRELAAMISNSIVWHSSKDHKGANKIPIWSQMLMDLAKDKTPLYEFYTGGTINTTVCDAEDKFFKEAGIPQEHRIRKAVEDLRKKANAHRNEIEEFYRLYRIQKYWDLKTKSKKGNASETTKWNVEYFSEEGHFNPHISAQECKSALKEAFHDLNSKFKQAYGNNTGIVPANIPNVRHLLIFYLRWLLDWKDIPGYSDYFSFDKKIFFQRSYRLVNLRNE